MSDHGIAWAMCVSGDARPVIFAVVGRTVYRRMPGYEWQETPFARKRLADIAILALIEEMETDGAILVVGPHEFPIEVEEADSVGFAAVRQLRIKGAGVIL